MHLVLLNQYYPPDEAPTGRVLEAVALEAAARGHEVTVLCSAAGGYAGRAGRGGEVGGGEGEPLEQAGAAGATRSVGGGVRVVRIGATAFGRGTFLGKLADYASFYAGVAWKLATMRQRPDRVVALTTPPYLSILARGLSKLRGGDHAHWVMDLYPDVMVAHGMLGRESVGHRLLRWLAAWGFGGRRNAGVLGLGPDMAERIAPLVKSGPVSWVPLWATTPAGEKEADLELKGNELRSSRGWGSDELVLMYSGNMGLGHRFGEFLEAAGSAGEGVRWVFYGGGKRRSEVEAFLKAHPEAPVALEDYVEHGQLAAHLRSADVQLASLEPSWDGTMVPSKLQGIASAGRPLLFVGTTTSSIGRWISEHEAGWVVAPGDGRGLAQAVTEARDEVERKRRGDAARRMGEALFEADHNVKRVVDLLTS